MCSSTCRDHKSNTCGCVCCLFVGEEVDPWGALFHWDTQRARGHCGGRGGRNPHLHMNLKLLREKRGEIGGLRLELEHTSAGPETNDRDFLCLSDHVWLFKLLSSICLVFWGVAVPFNWKAWYPIIYKCNKRNKHKLKAFQKTLAIRVVVRSFSVIFSSLRLMWGKYIFTVKICSRNPKKTCSGAIFL